MKKSEYKVVVLDVDLPGTDTTKLDKYVLSGYTPESVNTEKLLNDRAQQGWRLVSTFTTKESKPMNNGELKVEVLKAIFERVT